MKSAPLLSLSLSVAIPLCSQGAVFTVTGTSDAGPGTLRQAILDANASPGMDTITFAISSGPQTIVPASALPIITDPVIIDGTSQPGYNGTPLIELSGTGAGIGVNGLYLVAGNSVVRGLGVNGFQKDSFAGDTISQGGNGIVLDTGGGNKIVSCFIGTGLTGALRKGNTGSGIFINRSSGNVIGGTNQSERNIISGNGVVSGGGSDLREGILIVSTGNSVIGNYIGVAADGATALPNNYGISLHANSNTVGGFTALARNVISGNDFAGVEIWGNGNVVQGNFIGTDATGTSRVLANGNHQGSGVRIYAGRDNTVGGNAAGAGNLISGGNFFGVWLMTSSASSNTIQGNLIGVDATGSQSLGNLTGIRIEGNGNLVGGSLGFSRNIISGNGDPQSSTTGQGIFIDGRTNWVLGNLIGTDITGRRAVRNLRSGIEIFSAPGNVIGSAMPLEANTISGNGEWGVYVFEGDGTVIQGNRIGTDIVGTNGVGNSLDGVRIEAGRGVTVGGLTPGAGNTIAFNTGTAALDSGAGIYVGAGNSVSIQVNSIHDNAALGIDLGTWGVTQNDGVDFDGVQNFPEITAAVFQNGNVIITGVLNSRSNALYQIEFYANASADLSGYGEGMQFLGSTSVNTDEAGVGGFAVSLSTNIPFGWFITATATSPDRGTSEFSRATVLSAPTPPFISTQPLSLSVVSGNNVAFNVTAGGTAPLRYQWQFNGTNLANQTNAAMTIYGVTTSNNGDYRVIITNLYGSATSAVAVLSVSMVPAGALWAMGDNSSGQIGDGTTQDRSFPAFITNGTLTAAAGTAHGLFVMNDGTLWAMGANNYGQLGDGTTLQRTSPVFITNGVKAVAAGDGHSLFVKGDGTLWAMGYNFNGQLGDGTTTNRTSPVLITNGVVAVVAGSAHSLLLRSDGMLWGMGSGHAFDGTPFLRMSPKLITNNVIAVAAGARHTLFLTSDNSLWGVGDNFWGQLGLGTRVSPDSPVLIQGGVATVAAGNFHSLFAKTDGTLWAMGDNSNGQLGDSTTTDRLSPTFVTNGVRLVAAGNLHSLFVRSDRTLWGMGNNFQGQLGVAAAGWQTSPIFISDGVVAMAAGNQNDHSLFVQGRPSIITQPISQQVTVGDDLVLAVAAGGTAPLFYQWQFNGTNLINQTNAFLALSSATTNYSGNYRVVLTNVFGSATSSVATLIVTFAPFVLTQPTNYTVLAGGSARFSVGAGGIEPLSYQWKFLGTNLVNQTNATLVLTAVTTNSAGNYQVVITNAYGSVTSGVAFLTVLYPPFIWVQPLNKYITSGSNATFTVGVDGTAPLSFQWQYNSTNLLGRTNAFLTISGVTTNNVGEYRVIITNLYGSVTSAVATLNVGLAPLVTQQPTNQAILSGSGAAFSVAAGGTSPLAYQWLFKGAALPNQTNVTLLLGSVSLTNAGNYQVIVTNVYGRATSGVAVLTVLSPPFFTSQPIDKNVAAGGTALYGVTAGGTSPLSFQWQFNAVDLANQTNALLALHNANTNNAGAYQVVVTNTYGSATSAVAMLTVSVSPQWTLWGMGANGSGQLGDGTTSNRLSPTAITNGILAASTGSGYTLLVRNDSTLWAVGANNYGQLGDGTTSNRFSPVLVTTGVTAVVAGYTHSLFVKADGTLWGMGYNRYGQLGDGTTNNRATPALIATGVVAVAAGEFHSLYVRTDGTLWAMGLNIVGQLGDGSKTNKLSPVLIADGVVAAAAGYFQSLFLKNDGTLMGMGYVGFNGFGGVTPVLIADQVAAVVAGQDHSLFVRMDGTLWAIGDNSDGQLGNGDIFGTGRNSPERITNGVVSVAAGANHSMFVKNDGTLWAMGNNSSGQLGDGTTTLRRSPVRITGGVIAMAMGGENSHSLLISGLPIITSQPTNKSVVIGKDTTFSATAVGEPSLSYQWLFNGTNLLNQTNATCTLAAVATNNAGNYQMVVTNPYGSVTSSVATLTVLVPPFVTAQPVGQAVPLGSNATFSVTAGGTPPLTYAWQFNGTNLLNQTNASLTIDNVNPNKAGSYRAIITNFYGSVTSSVATLMVVVPPVPIIVTNGWNLVAESLLPTNGIVEPGETVTVSLSLKNLGRDTTNLTVRLLESGGILLPSGPQTYGLVSAGGAAVSRSFTFTAGAPCGSLAAAFALQDGAGDLGVVELSIPLALTFTTTGSFVQSLPITIPDCGIGGPYPSTNIVVGMDGSISKVTITVSNWWHRWTSLSQLLLVGPSNRTVLLMDNSGGFAANGATIIFDDAATLSVSDISFTLTNGTYRPTTYSSPSSLPAPATSTPYGKSLSAFAGLSPNGMWQLYAREETCFTGYSGLISNGWRLTITTTNATTNCIPSGARASVVLPSDTNATEGDSGGRTVILPVLLLWPSSQPINVSFATSDGTATVGDNDYVATNGVLTFLPGETNKSIAVLVNGDSKVERNEVFYVSFFSATNGTLLRAQASLTIINDDLPVLHISQSNSNVVVSWTDGTGCYTLEEAANLSPPIKWTTVTNAPTTISDIRALSLSRSAPSRFYRLIDSCTAVPLLQIGQTGNQVRISWPAWTTDWVLESCSSPMSVGWSTETNAPVVISGEKVLTFTPANASQFYRLVKTVGN